MKKEFGHVLRTTREFKNITQKQLADALGVAKGTVSRYESGEIAPSFDNLIELASIINESPSKLLNWAELESKGGQLTHFHPKGSEPDLVMTLPNGQVVTVEVKEYADNMFALSADENARVGTAGPRLNTVPLISWVQAGYGVTAVDNLHPGEGERIETTYRVRAHTYALRVNGDSMEPKFPQGCIVIVEPEDAPEHNKFVIVRQNGDEPTLKQYVEEGGLKFLKPLNPRYPIIQMREGDAFCGVVKRVEMDV